MQGLHTVFLYLCILGVRQPFTRSLAKGDLDRVCKDIAPKVRVLKMHKYREGHADLSGIFNFTVWRISQESVSSLLAYLGPDQYLFPHLVEYGY